MRYGASADVVIHPGVRWDVLALYCTRPVQPGENPPQLEVSLELAAENQPLYEGRKVFTGEELLELARSQVV
jgi:hypothetical protein